MSAFPTGQVVYGRACLNNGNEVDGAWNYTYPGFGTTDFKGNVPHGYQPGKANFWYYFQVCRGGRY